MKRFIENKIMHQEMKRMLINLNIGTLPDLTPEIQLKKVGGSAACLCNLKIIKANSYIPPMPECAKLSFFMDQSVK